jgi:hypothetical protein
MTAGRRLPRPYPEQPYDNANSCLLAMMFSCQTSHEGCVNTWAKCHSHGEMATTKFLKKENAVRFRAPGMSFIDADFGKRDWNLADSSLF